MIFSISLDQEIKCDTICRMVQELVNKFRSEHGEVKESILTMVIKTPIDSIGDSPVPKIEYKES